MQAELREDMEYQFHDLFTLQVPDCIVNPFIEEESGELEEELITLQKDIELKPKFYKYYQELWEKVKLFSLAFPTSYLVEREFSEVTHLLTKQLCKLRITDCGDLKLILSTTEPKIEKLLPLHHAHLSH